MYTHGFAVSLEGRTVNPPAQKGGGGGGRRKKDCVHGLDANGPSLQQIQSGL